jgi:hypothetical protein
MPELFLQVLHAGSIGTVMPERYFGAGFHIAGRAHDHHVAYKCAAGIAGTRKTALDHPGLRGRNTTTCCFSVMFLYFYKRNTQTHVTIRELNKPQSLMEIH